jgi:hypothetical protein
MNFLLVRPITLTGMRLLTFRFDVKEVRGMAILHGIF